MSFPAAMTMLVTNVIPLAQSYPLHVLPMRPDDIAATQALMSRKSAPKINLQASRELKFVERDEARPELVLTAGNRRRGGQVEIGALGGGREDAPSLLHVGVGFDF